MRFDQVLPGSEPPPLELPPLTRTDIVRYQGASGDMNPVHHDEPFATAAGFPAPLGVGMFTAGCMASWASDWLGPSRVRRTKIRFRKPVFPGARLSFHGKVAARDDVHRTIEVEVWGKDGDDVVVTGSLTFSFAEDL